MITAKEMRQPMTLAIPLLPDDCLEINRLLAAAVINPQFRHLLLKNPEVAIQNGYEDETFHFSITERSLILSIHANSLADLAKQLLQILDGQSRLQYSYPNRVSELVGG